VKERIVETNETINQHISSPLTSVGERVPNRKA